MTDLERAAWLAAARAHRALRRLEKIEDVGVHARDEAGQHAHLKPLILQAYAHDKARLAVELESVCRITR